MIILHFLATKDIKMCYREEFTPGRSPLPFLCSSDCAETPQAYFPTLRERKMDKDDGKYNVPPLVAAKTRGRGRGRVSFLFVCFSK